MNDQPPPVDPRLYPIRPFLAASLAVFRGERVLLARRARPPAAQAFSLPGGMVELGETLAEAALREVREEVAVTATVEGVVQAVEFLDRDDEGRVRRHFVVIAHWGEWLDGEPQCGPESIETMWIGESELARLEGPNDLPTTPRLTEVLRGAFAARRRHRQRDVD